MDASKYEPVMDTISNIQVWNMNILMEYNVKYFVLIMSTRFHVTGSSLLSCGRVFFSRGHELLSLAVT